MIRDKIAISIFLLFLLPAITLADLSITVEPNKNWGNAPTSNIKKLCENVALHFQEQLRNELKINGKLTIVYNPNNPSTWYNDSFGGGDNEYKMALSVKGKDWARFTYQFGHEFCHVMLNHNETHPNNPNSWFYEALCELANVWVLRRMGETWAYRAPYANWVGWRHNLTNYANNSIMGRAASQYAGTGAEWLAEWEDRMRNNTKQVFTYQRVAQLAYKILPIFEENPEAWNAIRQISGSKGKMSEFMRDWYNKVNPQDKRFVEAIAKEMGISVGTGVVASTINADVNNDGYVDLSDVLIVRSAIQNSVSYDTDVNGDGKTDEVDVLIVKAKAHAAIAAAAPSLKRRKRITTWGALKRR